MALAAAVVSGLCWGILGSWLTQGAFGERAWFAAPSGLLIGPLVYWLSRWFYSKSSQWLAVVAVLSTFFAVALFGLSLGVVNLARQVPGRIAWAVVLQGMNACLWGLIYMPVLWLLFALAWGNHLLVRHLEQRRA